MKEKLKKYIGIYNYKKELLFKLLAKNPGEFV